jgi:predicted phosphodiesterase
MSYSDKQVKFLKILRESGKDWSEVTSEYNAKFGTDNTLNSLRKTYKRYEDFDLDEDTLVKNMAATLRAKKTNKQLRKENEEILGNVISFDDFLNEIKKINQQCPIKFHKKTKKIKPKKIKRTIVSHISDMHPGAFFSSEEMDGINEFNPTVFARRLAKCFKEIMNYKLNHRKETDLVIVLNGDNLAGLIHNIDAVSPMSVQCAILMRGLIQGISYIANEFNKIRIYCTVGNHGRFIHKDSGRQMQNKWDSFETIVHLSLKEYFNKYSNIEFYIPKTPYVLFKVQGHTFLATHGDTTINVGNPSKKIDVENITKQLNNFNMGLNEKIDVLMVGHMHKATYQSLDNGADLLVNGTLMGTDPFAQSLGIVCNNPIQQMFEVTPEYKIGDMRFIRLKDADFNKSLDQIIEPYNGKF